MVLVIGASGGVGTTDTVCRLVTRRKSGIPSAEHVLSGGAERRRIAVDLDLSAGDVARRFGLQSKPSILDVQEVDNAGLVWAIEAAIQHPARPLISRRGGAEGIGIIAAPECPLLAEGAHARRVADVLGSISSMYPTVVDGGRILTPVVVAVAQRADLVVVVHHRGAWGRDQAARTELLLRRAGVVPVLCQPLWSQYVTPFRLLIAGRRPVHVNSQDRAGNSSVMRGAGAGVA